MDMGMVSAQKEGSGTSHLVPQKLLNGRSGSLCWSRQSCKMAGTRSSTCNRTTEAGCEGDFSSEEDIADRASALPKMRFVHRSMHTSMAALLCEDALCTPL